MKEKVNKEIDEKWDAIVWMGDFNSRIDFPHEREEEHGEHHTLKNCEPHRNAME